MPDYGEIIKRLEEASGPNRELGLELLLASGWRRICVGQFYGPIYHWSGPQGQWFREDQLADPTTSIETAISTVPERWSWRIGTSENRKTFHVVLGRSYPTNATVTQETFSTPAIALSLAALRARSMEESNG